MLRKDLEIMAPAGNFECLRAAIQGGADSVYFGVGRLNMRSRSANNFTPEDLPEVVRICREAGVRSYLTLNIVLYPEDLAPMREALDSALEAGVDAVIASDIAAIEYALRGGYAGGEKAGQDGAQRAAYPMHRNRADRVVDLDHLIEKLHRQYHGKATDNSDDSRAEGIHRVAARRSAASPALRYPAPGGPS